MPDESEDDPLSRPGAASVKVRLPPPLLRAVDEAARRGGASRSATVRELLVQALMGRGLWPPTEPVRAL